MWILRSNDQQRLDDIQLRASPKALGISEAVAMAVGSFAGYSAMRALREAAVGAHQLAHVGPNNHGDLLTEIWLGKVLDMCG